MHIIQKIAEEKIQEAIARGEFDNLPEHGKPYRMDGYLFEEPEKRIQRKLLKDHHFQPLPLTLRTKIERHLENLEQAIVHYRNGYAQRLEAIVRTGNLDLTYPPQEYWKFLPRHRRFLTHYLPIWLGVKSERRFQEAVREFTTFRQHALAALTRMVQDLLEIVEEYDDEIIKFCIRERDFFRLETGFAIKQFQWWTNYFMNLFPGIEEDDG